MGSIAATGDQFPLPTGHVIAPATHRFDQTVERLQHKPHLWGRFFFAPIPL